MSGKFDPLQGHRTLSRALHLNVCIFSFGNTLRGLIGDSSLSSACEACQTRRTRILCSSPSLSPPPSHLGGRESRRRAVDLDGRPVCSYLQGGGDGGEERGARAGQGTEQVGGRGIERCGTSPPPLPPSLPAASSDGCCVGVSPAQPSCLSLAGAVCCPQAHLLAAAHAWIW